MDYYHDVRGYNIKDEASYPHPYDTNRANFINHMAFDMLRQSWGVSLAGYRDGIIKHVRETATSNWSAVTVRDVEQSSYSNSLKYRSAISNGHPVTIRFNFFVENSEGLNHHFVAGMHWELTGINRDNLFFGYKDPDGGSGNTGTIYRDWGNYDQDFEFVHLTF